MRDIWEADQPPAPKLGAAMHTLKLPNAAVGQLRAPMHWNHQHVEWMQQCLDRLTRDQWAILLAILLAVPEGISPALMGYFASVWAHELEHDPRGGFVVSRVDGDGKFSGLDDPATLARFAERLPDGVAEALALTIQRKEAAALLARQLDEAAFYQPKAAGLPVSSRRPAGQSRY